MRLIDWLLSHLDLIRCIGRGGGYKTDLVDYTLIKTCSECRKWNAIGRENFNGVSIAMCKDKQKETPNHYGCIAWESKI